MSNFSINSKDVENYLDENFEEVFDKMVHQMRKIKNSQNEPIDDKHVNCSICGGRYNKSIKCLHDKTKKHVSALASIKDMIKIYIRNI